MPSGKDDSHGLKLKILLPTAGVSSAASSGVQNGSCIPPDPPKDCPQVGSDRAVLSRLDRNILTEELLRSQLLGSP